MIWYHRAEARNFSTGYLSSSPSLRRLETFPIERDFLLSLAMWLKRFLVDGVGVAARSWDMAQKWRANTLSLPSPARLLRSTVSVMKLPEGEIRISPPVVLMHRDYRALSPESVQLQISFGRKQRGYVTGKSRDCRIVMRFL